MDASAQLHKLFRQIIPVTLHRLQGTLHLLLFPLTYQVNPVPCVIMQQDGRRSPVSEFLSTSQYN